MPRFAFEAVPRALDANAVPVPGGKLYAYLAGTTTPISTYSNAALSSFHAFPIVADSAGFFPEIYVPNGSYKAVAQTPAGVTLWTADNIAQGDTTTNFVSRAALTAAMAAGYLADGSTVYVNGIAAIIDATATGSLSAAHDLGIDGVRLPGNVIPIRWWTEGMTASATTKIAAANAYALARVGANNLDLVLDENLNIADPVQLGGNVNIAINTLAGRITVIAGATLASTPALYAVTISGPSVTHRLGTVDTNHMCRAYAYNNCTNAAVIGPRAERFKGHGHRTIDGCAGMTLFQPTGFEYSPAEQSAGGFNTASFVSDGIYLDTNDVRVVQAHIGYCNRPIVFAAGGTANQLLNCHPFNAVPAGGVARSDTISIWNECSTARVFVDDCYIDCGYAVDTTGTMHMSNCFFTHALVTLTNPYIRISADAAPGVTTIGSVVNANASIGYYTGAYAAVFATPADFTQNIADQSSYGARNSATGRQYLALPNHSSAAGEDIYVSKQGDATTKIVTKYTPGTGADVSLTILNGEAWLARPISPSRFYVGPAADKSGIGSNVGDLRFFVSNVQTHAIGTTGHLTPNVDNTQNLGSGALRMATIYAGTGAINTSDAREKQDIFDLSVAERAVAVRVKGLIKRFKFRDAVAAKDTARWHFGVIAQEVIAAFQAEGLDAMAYGAVCHDVWEASPAVINEEGVLTREAVTAGDRYGVRYDELAIFMLAAL